MGNWKALSEHPAPKDGSKFFLAGNAFGDLVAIGQYGGYVFGLEDKEVFWIIEEHGVQGHYKTIFDRGAGIYTHWMDASFP